MNKNYWKKEKYMETIGKKQDTILMGLHFKIYTIIIKSI